MIVVKFGGSSLAGAERMRAAARIVAAHRRERPVVSVVSAMAGVTDALLRLAALATAGGDGPTGWAGPLAALRDRHDETLGALITSTPSGPALAARYVALWAALEADLRSLAARSQDEVGSIEHEHAAFSGWGERLSALLFGAALAAEGVAAAVETDEPVLLAATAEVLAAPGGLEAAIGDPATVAATRTWLLDRLDRLDRLDLERAGERVVVLPGYIARTSDGGPTTLGRNGSDCSAALFGAAHGAEAVYIYSDVAGVHRADPRVVPGAPLLPALTYADAAAAAVAGARVLHPGAIQPVARLGIPLRLRSALDPHGPGTDIVPALPAAWKPAGGRMPWVVAARPASSAALAGLVEVAAISARGGAWREPHDGVLNGTDRNEGMPEDGAAYPRDLLAAAFELLHAGPRPVELAMRRDRLTLRIPSAQAAAVQRRLFDALERAGESEDCGLTAAS